MLRNWAPLLSIALLCAIPTVSRADNVFDVTGTFEYVGGPVLGGTYTISDVGVVTAADLTIEGIQFTNIISSTGPTNGPTGSTDFTQASVHDGVNPNDYIYLAISDSDFGMVCSTANEPCIFTAPSVGSFGLFSFANVSGLQLNLISGSASLAPTATPEPSSLALLGTGLVGAFGLARRKFRKA